MRLFTAIELPDDVRRHLESLIEAVKRNAGMGGRSVSITRPENLHITLKFLGEVAEDKVTSICEALRGVHVDGPMGVWTDGFELLPPPRGPVRVIAAGLGGDVGKVSLLVRAIEATCEPLGFPTERREYRPHVTLARARDPLPPRVRDDLPRDLRAHFPGPPFDARGFTLFESRLRSCGPEYIPLARFPA